ncbi:hypothetical protein MMC29_004298 [Sticta canariensis]|nr:hypothetical protein [Sticta canariensis]
MSSSSSTTAKTAKDIILGDSSTYNQWYSNIKDSVPSHLWRYFDPVGNAVFTEPVPPIQPVCEEALPLPPVAASGHSTRSSQTLGETPDQQAARENARYREQLDTYSKLHAIYRDDRIQWEKYCETDSKLRDRIKATISKLKAGPLSSENPTHQWLVDLRRSSAPTAATTRQTVKGATAL